MLSVLANYDVHVRVIEYISCSSISSEAVEKMSSCSSGT